MTASMPANIRKRSELYARNIHKRGNVKSSLDPKTEQKHEAERLRKKGLGPGTPVHVSSSRRLLLALVAITVGSALYQVLSPMFASGGSSAAGGTEATKSQAALTREQQAEAAAAVLKSLNAKAAERYLKSARTWQPAEKKAPLDEETPAIVEGPLV
ncbi:hypothetical protein FBU31_006615 [Coemansia sp. 'formosensis']|nr:hypothetical protein FBU31_006615 [Coemansia sp. 'formosensis']